MFDLFFRRWVGISFGIVLVGHSQVLGQGYSRAQLPSLLEFLDGRKVEALEDWGERR
ncbi:MAG: hypothetical protein VX704_08795 [Verrucomicrobiota bacterium]|nr:hypothetical protein [Verrucomicrobiota bacterium]